MPPRGVNWQEEAASTAQSMRASYRPQRGHQSGDGDEMVRVHRRRLRSFWNAHGPGFTEWWADLPLADKGAFLRTTNPIMPERRGESTVIVAGRRQDCSGSALMLPEINVAGLTEDGGQGLLNLYNNRAHQARSADEAEAAGQVPLIIDDLELRDCSYMERLLKANAVRPVLHSPPAGSIVTMGEDGTVQAYTVAPNEQSRRDVAQMRERSGPSVQDAQAYFLMRQRQVLLLSALLAWGDSYRVDVLGRTGQCKALAAAGCSQCGTHKGEGGKDLLWCPCAWVVYCGTTCQRKDWPAHKVECKRIRAQQAEERAEKQQAAQRAGGEQQAAGGGAASEEGMASSAASAVGDVD